MSLIDVIFNKIYGVYCTQNSICKEMSVGFVFNENSILKHQKQQFQHIKFDNNLYVNYTSIGGCLSDEKCWHLVGFMHYRVSLSQTQNITVIFHFKEAKSTRKQLHLSGHFYCSFNYKVQKFALIRHNPFEDW